MKGKNMDTINETLGRYYTKCFADHGASARGVDWHNSESLTHHYDKILAVIRPDQAGGRVSLLDIGCGYGGLLDRAKERGLDVEYSGIDLVEEMTAYGARRHPDAQFARADFLNFDPGRRFDYVVANGVLTEKLDVSILEFGRFARRMIRRMFDLADKGIAFNMMTSYVNFTAANLYYQNPSDIISYCAAELSTKWVMDHGYDYYDFTMYVYR
jgi:SAM-dependent methyltransferase